MNNETKVVLTVKGIPGRTRHFDGKKKMKVVEQYYNKRGELKESTFYYRIPGYIYVPVTQKINLSKTFFDWATSRECPSFFDNDGSRKDLTRKWERLTPIARLELHLARICEDRNGASFVYNILED